jgi:hypothetical protein
MPLIVERMVNAEAPTKARRLMVVVIEAPP